ncbi:TAM domain methyltransferase [Colletotrichum orchidophilum]|uniref:TAM domain methyltransferase n=1 Tax=Colletotrichum orchidophilum TaxID=1209926 RepID=A0A1G4B298_9PEZI|nr:TAM domain methyltransferase [Colletotrichum orchidophilum]OHE95540.1 TAM domain methyltransferase [Colletotrichum orchidophilum]
MAEPSSMAPIQSTASASVPVPEAETEAGAVPAPLPVPPANDPPNPNTAAPLEPHEDEGNVKGNELYRGFLNCGRPHVRTLAPASRILIGFTMAQTEMDRLDVAHAMMVKAAGSRLYNAPLKKKKVPRIIDIGTGARLCT